MNLLITGAWGDAQKYIDQIKAMGYQVRFMQWEKDEVPDYDWVEGVICNGLFLYHPISSFPNLKYIQFTSAGFDRADMAEAEKRNIKTHNARGVYSTPMAEYAVAGVLSLFKRVVEFHEQQERHEWKKIREIRELSGKRVVIVGCGDVGRECAKRFRAFGCKVLGFNRSLRENPAFDEIRPLDELNSALPEADVLILTLGLSAETRHLMNVERLALLKSGAVLVNLARGALIDTEALIAALPKLTGAVLDVFEEEPLPESSPLWDAENVILTPHNSFVGEGNGARLVRVIIDSLKKEAIL